MVEGSLEKSFVESYVDLVGYRKGFQVDLDLEES